MAACLPTQGHVGDLPAVPGFSPDRAAPHGRNPLGGSREFATLDKGETE